MSISSKINKENFRLLDLSSDEESEDLQLEVIPSRKKKVTRRERNRNTLPRPPDPNIGAEVQCALRWAIRGTLLLWLLMLTWICAALYDQVSTMRVEFVKVSMSSDSVGDALQVCHTAAKELRANTSELNERLLRLEQEHRDLAERVQQATGELTAVSEQLAAAPKLADMPRQLANLRRTVADFGSQIKGYDDAFNTARKQAVAAASGVEEVKTLLHDLEARTNQTIANVTANVKMDEEIKGQVMALNTTLTVKIDALQSRIEEISRPASTAAPVPPTSPPTSSTTTSTTSTTTVVNTPPPGSPVKPNVLHDQ